MANAFVTPSAVIGLMGAQRRQNSLLPFPVQADALDEMMFQRAPNGYVEGAGGQYFAADRSGQMPMAQQAPATPQRERVSGWRVLERVLGGDLPFQAVDAERARLQAEALKPQQQARIQAALGAINDPREQALFLGLGGEDWLKATGARFTPQVVGAGAAQAINGMRTIEQPTFAESGDTTLARTSAGINPVYTRTTPSIAERNVAERNRIDAIGAGQATVGNYRIDADGNLLFEAPDQFSLGPNDTRYSGGVQIAQGNPAARAPSAGEIKRADDLELSLANDQNSVDRVSSALALITDPDGTGPLGPQVRIGPWENFGAGLMNWTGRSNANSLGIAQIKTTVESLRQGILNDATGPQTEGDALRALNSILAGLDDPKVIAQGFQDYLDAKRRTMAVKQGQIGRIRGGSAAPSAGGSVPPPPPGFELDR